MRALVKTARGPGNMELREVAERPLDSGEVRIEVRSAGICGSDLHIYHDQINIPIRTPVVVGHEFSGQVAEIGPGVEKARVGDKVTALTAIRYCAHCRYCRSEFYNLCPDRETLGYMHNGAFAPTTIVPARNVLTLPENVDFRAGAFTEPLACCVHAVTELTGVSARDVVAIVGPGAIGLLCLQVVLTEGGRAIVYGTRDDAARLELARKLGADHTMVVDEEDALGQTLELTEGYGVDIALECSGHPDGASLALQLVRKQGKYTQVGLFGRPINIDFEQIAFKELQTTGSLGQKPTAWKRSLDLLASGKIDVHSLISHTFPLSQWQEAFATFQKREGVKLFLDVNT